MRVKVAERGHVPDRVLYGIIRAVSGFRAPDVVRTLRYRKPFFGGPHTVHTQASMRGASAWSVFERELFAAYVSRINHCHF